MTWQDAGGLESFKVTAYPHLEESGVVGREHALGPARRGLLTSGCSEVLNSMPSLWFLISVNSMVWRDCLNDRDERPAELRQLRGFNGALLL